MKLRNLSLAAAIVLCCAICFSQLRKTPPFQSITEDDGTQMTTHGGVNIHICPPGEVMAGVDAENNRFLCYAPFPNTAPRSLTVDTGTHQIFMYSEDSRNGKRGALLPHSIHVCPAGSLMVGWNQSKDWLVCTPSPPAGGTPGQGFGTVHIDGPGGTQVTEPNHPSVQMHSCMGTDPSVPFAMSGIQVADNVLVCTNDNVTYLIP